MDSSTTPVETFKTPTRTVEEATRPLESALREALDNDGFLSDVAPCTVADLTLPAAVAPWSSFGDLKLYKSASATQCLRSLLKCVAPGTSSSFDDIISAISHGHDEGTSSHYSAQQSFCYLVGGQVRDVLRGVLSTDIDFGYTCDAHDAALVCVANSWPTKYKCIGPTDTPNYVLIGDCMSHGAHTVSQTRVHSARCACARTKCGTHSLLCMCVHASLTVACALLCVLYR